jgi:hypothetical protein
MNIRQLIKETLQNYKKPQTKKCGCGCNTCDKAPILKENLSSRAVISENLKYHIDNKKPLTENTFRYGSKAFIDLWYEARQLVNEGKLTLQGLDKEILEETDLGQVAIYEGKIVALDMPLLEAEYQGQKVELNKPKRGGSKKFYVYVKDPKTKKVKKVSFGAKDGGQRLSVKLSDPKARSAFSKRHNCPQKKDKTTPGYWSCRINRYWKSLGGSKNYSGYW